MIAVDYYFKNRYGVLLMKGWSLTAFTTGDKFNSVVDAFEVTRWCSGAIYAECELSKDFSMGFGFFNLIDVRW